jgi:hypothetical protein
MARVGGSRSLLEPVYFINLGAGAGNAKVNLRINSNDTLVDHT